MMTMLVAIALMALACCVAAVLDDDERKWTIDDVLQIERGAGVRISPDGRRCVWEKHAFYGEQQKVTSNLMLTDLRTLETIQLTQGETSCHSAFWSPDGKHLAFLSDRPVPNSRQKEVEEPKPQVWLLRTSGGEARPLTDLPRGVVALAWRDAKTVVVAAQEDRTYYESELRRKKDTSRAVDDEAHEPPVRLFVVGVEDKKLKRLTTNMDRITALSISPDGRRAVTIHDQSLRYTYDQKIKPATFVVDLGDGSMRRVFEGWQYNIDEVAWAPDSSGFFVRSSFSTHPIYANATVGQAYWCSSEDLSVEPIDLAWDRGLAFGGLAAVPGGFVCLLEDGVATRLAIGRRTGDGWILEPLEREGQGGIFQVAASLDGKRLVMQRSSGTLPTQFCAAQIEGRRVVGEKPFTRLNESLDKKTMARVEIVRWKGALDQEVEGLLYYPHGYTEGERLPLMVMIHGGPHAHDRDAFSDSYAYPINLIAQRGAFVFRPNYHGSSGYGLEFSESIADGRYYSLPVEDILQGIERLIERGLVDPEKMGTMGWSNGAILSTALIVEDQRFKVASSGAGGSEWVADWGACAFGQSFSNYYLGKSPLEDPGLYQREAPLYRFDRVATPTIFFHGTEDTAVPPHHGWLQYRALQTIGKVQTKLVLFPGEPHGLTKLGHRRRKLEEELAWFDEHLFGPQEPVVDEVLKVGSPLDNALHLARAAQVGKAFGVEEHGVLVPEVVRYKGVQVGRFEVTRAQWSCFRRQARPVPGEENLPASGITYDEARAYCRWLSRRTGSRYRLPNEKEAQTLYESGDGNTLDHWAGYAPNPESAESLRRLASGVSLVKPVGSFAGVGKPERVYDLVGNVAEWVALKSGSGRAMGGAACLAADPKCGSSDVPLEYCGLRVVRETGR